MQTQYQIQYKSIIHAPAEKVWEAMTNPEIVKQYFFGTELISDWKQGGDIVFQGEWEGKKYRDAGKILEIIRNKKLSYSYLSSWSGKEDKEENYLWICYDLQELGTDTELCITQSNYTEELAKHSEANWAALIDGMKKLIE